VTRVALAHGAGIALALAGIPLPPALALLLLLAAPLWPWRRPPGALPPALLLLACIAGLLSGHAGRAQDRADCRLHLPREGRWEVTGRFVARVEAGGGAPFRVESGVPGDCRALLRAWWPAALPPPPTGVRLRLAATWEGRDFPEPGRAEWAGRLRVRGDPPPEVVPGGDLPGRLLRVRGVVQDRMYRLWGPRAPMVEALVLARREHLDPDLRAAFARSGTAHLLAISGFHVGVVAGLLLGLLRVAGHPPRRGAAFAAAGSWLYVLGIGAPDAALRAALILTLLAGARLRGVAAVSVGTLSTAFLLLLVADPRALGSVGFQLSFAGTLGLVTLRRPLEAQVERLWIRAGRRPPRRGPAADRSDRWLRGSSEGLVAGVAATLPTLPLLAWHFDTVSVVGVPATLLAAPGVALAIPGIGASLMLSLASEGAGRFLAGGVGLLLALVEACVRGWAALPGSTLWVSRPGLLAAGGVGLATVALLARTRAGRIRAPMRRVLGAVAAATAVSLLPLVPGGRVLELHVIDVGQGDALALRLPGGAWIGVDAGPASATWDAGARRVVPYLRRQGARRLEALVLTHAHLDHLGGAAAVLEGIPVRGVVEPARPTPSDAYLRALVTARDRGASWWPARAGTRLGGGEVELRILHPEPLAPDASDAGRLDADPNAVSVVLHVRWGEASILLTGDAYADVEARVLSALGGRLTLLKAGHHGSRTSTSRALVNGVRPEVTVVTSGDGNRYGHPHAEVVERLAAVGSRVVRTDRDGSIRIRLHRDGRWQIDTDR
jgi:competence protein ComEC